MLLIYPLPATILLKMVTLTTVILLSMLYPMICPSALPHQFQKAFQLCHYRTLP